MKKPLIIAMLALAMLSCTKEEQAQPQQENEPDPIEQVHRTLWVIENSALTLTYEVNGQPAQYQNWPVQEGQNIHIKAHPVIACEPPGGPTNCYFDESVVFAVWERFETTDSVWTNTIFQINGAPYLYGYCIAGVPLEWNFPAQ